MRQFRLETSANEIHMFLVGLRYSKYKAPGTVPPLRTRGFPDGLMTLFYLSAGHAEVILILDLPVLPAC